MLDRGRNRMPRLWQVEHDSVGLNISEIIFHISNAQLKIRWKAPHEAFNSLTSDFRMIGATFHADDPP